MTAPLLTARDVADRLGVCLDYSYRLLAKGDIATVRFGGTVRCTEEALADFIASRTTTPRKSRKGAAA